ncbi:MAG TPA: GAF and ANTAR domain-containing protein [Mycobacteriales bacterium]|jgi:GAF domain-containing protein|nr:GAF and ANTAR domain-containing protein [Mycobacteriales bacterium]
MLCYVPPNQLANALLDITAQLVANRDSASVLRSIVEACKPALGAAAAGIMLVDPRGGAELAAASDERAGFVELLQLQTDQGPCLDCIRANRIISVPRLQNETDRWPAFVPAAVDAGYRAMHAIPMRLDGQAVGGLNLLHTTHRLLTPFRHRLGQSLADLGVLALSQERDAQRRSERLVEQTLAALNDRVALGQAIGLIAGSLDVDPGQAREMLRRYASHQNQPLRDIVLALTGGALGPSALGALLPRPA